MVSPPSGDPWRREAKDCGCASSVTVLTLSRRVSSSFSEEKKVGTVGAMNEGPSIAVWADYI